MENIKRRLELAQRSLLGLSIGDAFGETFFGEEKEIIRRIENRKIKVGSWGFTDDTVMGIGIYKTLEKFGEIKQDELARIFSENYKKDIRRGYGGTAHTILSSISNNEYWKRVSSAVFDGMGSMGNGSAMRVAPIGAYFYDDMEKLKKQAALSAEVTHYNKEGIAGAVAIAVAASIAVQDRMAGGFTTAGEFIKKVFEETPESDTKYMIQKAMEIPKESGIDFLVSILGNGSMVIVKDTVPISVWFMAHFRESFEEAMWRAVSALGDRDTICAIVGGVVALYADIETIPKQWIENTEKIESSIFW